MSTLLEHTVLLCLFCYESWSTFNNYKSNWKIKNKTNDIHLKSDLNLLGHFELDDSVGNNKSTYFRAGTKIHTKSSHFKNLNTTFCRMLKLTKLLLFPLFSTVTKSHLKLKQPIFSTIKTCMQRSYIISCYWQKEMNKKYRHCELWSLKID